MKHDKIKPQDVVDFYSGHKCICCGSREVGKDTYRPEDEKTPTFIGYSCNRCNRNKVVGVTGNSDDAVVEATALAIQRFYTL